MISSILTTHLGAHAAPETSRNIRSGPYRSYLVFGAPGSGKGTQGKALGSVPRFFHCACGDVFRSMDTRTKVGQAFIYYSSRGELVPDEICIELWKESITNAVEGHRFKPELDALLLDGIPRNLKQAKLMKSLIEVKKVFHLSCPDRAQLVERLRKRALKENRLDDANEAVIRKRLETYEAETKPVLDSYRPELIHTIDATQPPARVLWEILGLITGEEAVTGRSNL
jgi:adenylate kinase